MKLSVDIPDEWRTLLSLQANEADYKSVTGYVRHLIAQAIEVPEVKAAWGGTRTKQVKQDDKLEKKQDAQVAQDAQHEETKAPLMSAKVRGGHLSRGIGWSKDQAIGKKPTTGKRVQRVDDIDF